MTPKIRPPRSPGGFVRGAPMTMIQRAQLEQLQAAMELPPLTARQLRTWTEQRAGREIQRLTRRMSPRWIPARFGGRW